jgi:hypothetical protein
MLVDQVVEKKKIDIAFEHLKQLENRSIPIEDFRQGTWLTNVEASDAFQGQVESVIS